MGEGSNRNLFLTVLEAGSLCQQVWFLPRLPMLAPSTCSPCPHVAFPLFLTCLVSLMCPNPFSSSRTWVRLDLVSNFKTIASLKAKSPNIVTLKVRALTCGCGGGGGVKGGDTIRSITLLFNGFPITLRGQANVFLAASKWYLMRPSSFPGSSKTYSSKLASWLFLELTDTLLCLLLFLSTKIFTAGLY